MRTSIDDLIYRCRAELDAAISERARDPQWGQMEQIRATCLAEKRAPTEAESVRVQRGCEANQTLTTKIEALRARHEFLLEEKRADEADDAKSRERRDGASLPDTPEQRYSLDGKQAAEPIRGADWIRSTDGRPAAVERSKSFRDHWLVSEHGERNHERELAVVGMHGSIGQMLRSMSTTSGSALVPTVWAADIIDRARNEAAVLKAGATMVPMEAKIVQVARLTADPTASFRTEGSTVTASDPSFDNVTLTATTMSALVVGSIEWFQDADNVDEIVTNAIGKAIGLQLDLAALYGSITTGHGAINLATPPNPRGVLGNLNANAPSHVLGAATNGTAQTAASYWNEILDLIYTVRDSNEDPNALIWNTKAARQYAKAYDTTGQPLRSPDAVTSLDRYESNQIPSYTQGTMASRATDVFAGDWSKLLIGQRLEMSVQTLTERYAELGQVGIIAHWRGDIQLARPNAFAVYSALQGA